jgi:hypothetical protein
MGQQLPADMKPIYSSQKQLVTRTLSQFNSSHLPNLHTSACQCIMFHLCLDVLTAFSFRVCEIQFCVHFFYNACYMWSSFQRFWPARHSASTASPSGSEKRTQIHSTSSVNQAGGPSTEEWLLPSLSRNCGIYWTRRLISVLTRARHWILY